MEFRDSDTNRCDKLVYKLSAEETAINNSQVLSNRKRFFFKDLKTQIDMLGYLFIILLYLLDLSFFRLLVRMGFQLTLGNPFPSYRTSNFTDDHKKKMSKAILYFLFFLNGLCLAVHLVFGAYNSSNFDDTYLHGGLTIQVVGESLPSSRFVLVFYDALIFASQLVLFNVTCVIETKTTPNSAAEGDGYTGKADVVSIDMLNNLQLVRDYSGGLPEVNVGVATHDWV